MKVNSSLEDIAKTQGQAKTADIKKQWNGV